MAAMYSFLPPKLSVISTSWSLGCFWRCLLFQGGINQLHERRFSWSSWTFSIWIYPHWRGWSTERKMERMEGGKRLRPRIPTKTKQHRRWTVHFLMWHRNKMGIGPTILICCGNLKNQQRTKKESIDQCNYKSFNWSINESTNQTSYNSRDPSNN